MVGPNTTKPTTSYIIHNSSRDLFEYVGAEARIMDTRVILTKSVVSQYQVKIDPSQEIGKRIVELDRDTVKGKA